MFPFLASWNELAGTPMEAPLDGSITRAAYRMHARNMQLQKIYTKLQLRIDVRVSGRKILNRHVKAAHIVPDIRPNLPFSLTAISK
jgi:hypothetical protein